MVATMTNSSDEDGEGNEECNCVDCGDNYSETHLIKDWLQCNMYQVWLHENCTEFDDMCSECKEKKKG